MAILYGPGSPTKERVNGRPEFSKDINFFVQRQVDKLIALGFHNKIHTKYSKDKREARYRKDFEVPKDFNPLISLRDRIQEYLVVDPRVNLDSQLKKIGITDFVTAKSISNITPVPQQPYLALIYGTHLKTPCSPFEVVNNLKSEESASPLIEVVSLYLQKPSYFEGVAMYSPGSVKQDVQTFVMQHYGRPELHISTLGVPEIHRRAVTRYKEVVLLGRQSPSVGKK